MGDFGAFWLPRVFCTCWVHIYAFFQAFDVKIPKFFCSRLWRSQAKILLWSGCAPKMGDFLVGDVGAFWLPCVFCTFWVHIRAFFSDVRSKSPKFFCSRLRRSQTKVLFGRYAHRRYAIFSVRFWRIWTSVCVLHVLSTYLGVTFTLSMWKFSKISLSPSALANKDAFLVGMRAENERLFR